MREFFRFWRECTRRAFRGNTAFANDWQWLFGAPAASFLAASIASSRGATELTSGQPIVDGIIAALVAFLITWAIAFFIRLLNAPAKLFNEQRDRANLLAKKLEPKLLVTYNKNIGPCNDILNYQGGSKGVCFRLQVTTQSLDDIKNCTGWLNGIDRMKHISPVQLFWIGSPSEKMTEDVKENIYKYLQVCEILQINKVIMATQGRNWPVGENSIFRPGEYIFDIIIKADGVRAELFKLKLNWTGDWKTAEASVVA